MTTGSEDARAKWIALARAAMSLDGTWYTADELQNRRAIPEHDGNFIAAVSPKALFAFLAAPQPSPSDVRDLIERQVLAAAYAINPEVFSEDPDTAHRAASPLKVEIVQANVVSLAQRVVAAALSVTPPSSPVAGGEGQTAWLVELKGQRPTPKPVNADEVIAYMEAKPGVLWARSLTDVRLAIEVILAEHAPAERETAREYERAQIVAYLRKESERDDIDIAKSVYLSVAADNIERGDHRPAPKPEGVGE